MDAVIEAVVSVGLEPLLKKLVSSDILKFARKKHLEAELEKWKNELMEIRELLDDAEEKQIAKQSVKKWLADLRDLAFDMEDVLDDFSYHYQAFPSKLKAELADIGDHEGKGTTSKACQLINTTYYTCTLLVTGKIKKITARLQGIYARKTGLGLEKVAYITQSTLKETPRIKSPLAYEPRVYGRDAEKQTLINMLFSGRDANEATSSSKTETEIKTHNFSVVSIVGMGGMGKTTLARLVYDHVKTRLVYNHVEERLVYDGDEITTKHFDLKAWARVSDQFDAERITKIILKDLTPGSYDSLNLDQSQSKLKEILEGKRFLLVLDDVWTDDHNDWSCLRAPFFWGSRGSKVIVTTRSTSVALMMRMEGDKKNDLLELQGLSHDDCWSVFKEHAFRNIANAEERSNLALIGNKIVEQCGGLPFAAEALGALLGHEPREERWNGLLNSKIWESSIHEFGILPALRLSYNNLSPPVKKCFSYCAIFPKDYEFGKEELIRLWMAECLIIPRDEIQMEVIGHGYFEQLLSRLFFHPSRTNRSLFVMHHLVHDLAKFVSGEICFSMESNPPQQNIFQKVRYSSFIRGRHDVFKKFEAFSKMKNLRSFIALPTVALWYDYYISNKVLEELVPKLRRLRVLLLSGYKISEIPDSFGHDLKHLRYLNLSATEIKRLPDSIGKLYHLETLILSQCRSLARLPCSIGKLNNLRYLDVTDTSLEEMPPQTNRLRSLQVLSNFIVGKEDGLSLNVKELKNLPHLRGGLWISKLENLVSVQHAREASLNMKRGLEELRMEWSSSDDSQISEKNQLDVLESLQPHSDLRKLSICGYGGSKFPRWISGRVSFSKMVAIDMKNCGNCISLPCLGWLPMLQHLKIEGMNKIRTIGAEFYGRVDMPFPSLKSLSFRNMFKWEVWKHPSSSLSEPYPVPLNLTMEDCPSLMEKLPTYLPSLQHLSISSCPQLGVSLAGLNRSAISRLQVQRCTGEVFRSLIALPSLTDLKINRIAELTRLHEGLLPGLQRLQINNCYELTRLWEEKQENIPSKLEYLKIESCNKLEKLPNELHMLECLKELSIVSCPRLVSLSEFGFPPMLRHLDISDCYGLRHLSDMMMKMGRDISGSSSSNDVVLESLEIRKCPYLIGFLEGQLLSTLKLLIISECENLRSLPEEMMQHLEYLHISMCPSLHGFPEGVLPTSLNHLRIESCAGLTSLPEGIMQQHRAEDSSSDNYTSTDTAGCGGLRVLEILDCSHLISFPTGRFPATLERLEISECPQLKSISEEMMMESMSDDIDNCSLERLVLRHYPNLQRLPEDCFYNLRELCIEECENLGFVPAQLQNLSALTSLTISHCQNIGTPLSDWGLPTLLSLKQLTLSGIFPEVASFSVSDDQNQNHPPLLPTSLSSLSIKDFPNLKSLTSLAIHSLTSLEMLRIEGCPKLRSFCPRKRLPLTLSQLYINGCPLLQKRCPIKIAGRDCRNNIRHIPYVEIDHECIFDQ